MTDYNAMVHQGNLQEQDLLMYCNKESGGISETKKCIVNRTAVN